MLDGSGPQGKCNDCKLNLLPEHQRESVCQARCGGKQGAVAQTTVLAVELYSLHLRMLGGEQIEDLPRPYRTAIGFMRQQMAGLLLENAIGKVMSLMFGKGKANG